MYNNNINTLDNNKNNEFIIELYNSVFNNIYLKRIILNHLSIYNILYKNIGFKSQKQFEQFKYKEYLNSITLYEYGDLSQLPQNIKQIKIIKMNKDNEINNLKSIPNHIESIKIKTSLGYLDIESKFSTIDPAILSKIVSFYMNLSSGKEVLNKALQSVTELRINVRNKIELLKKEMLPSNLKRIKLHDIKSIENGCFLKSLSSASLNNCSPLIVNQILSNNLIKLEFICDSKNDYFKFGSNIIFPKSLQELTIECYSFKAKLPSNLKSLDLSIIQLEDTIIFPRSLEHINVLTSFRITKEIFNNKESVPCNLKSLKFPCSSIVDNNGQSILPDKLEKLIFGYYVGFNQELQINQLPSSLTYLNIGNSYNHDININVLPSSLKTLIFGHIYSQIINPLAIPQQLELLAIENPYYNHPINLPASTHPNILIKCNNLLFYNPSNTSIRKLRLPNNFNSSLSILQLQDKSSLEYLHLGYRFNQPIELSDLPIDNNIRTLELSYHFNQIINLEHFQNLETIIVDHSNPGIITTTITNQQQIIYNNYNLKSIILPPYNSEFNNHFLIIDKNFYQFIKLKTTED